MGDSPLDEFTTARVAALKELMSDRWSCRAFLDRPVPAEVSEELFTLAQLSPSWCNTQPWHLTVLEGRRLQRIRDSLLEYVAHTAERPDYPFPSHYQGVHQQRRRECAWLLYDAVGVSRGDRVASHAQALENYRFFGAPSVAVLTTEESLGVYGAIDCGVYAGNFMIAAQALGLGTIALASLASHSPFFRESLSLSPNRKIVMGIAYGYPDLAHPANGFRTSRAQIVDVVTRVS